MTTQKLTLATYAILLFSSMPTIPLRVRKHIAPVTRCEALAEIVVLPPLFLGGGIPLMSGEKMHKRVRSFPLESSHPTELVSYPSFPMTSTTSDPGHAVGPSGALKDTSEMVWTYDEDESIPFPSGDDSGTDPISSGGLAPATVVAATRRTARIHRPSLRALEAVEASLSSASIRPGAKRKARSDPAPERRVTRKIIIDSDVDSGSDVAADCSNDGATTEPATEPAEDEYESIKAMADADNQVCIPSSRLNCLLTHFSGFNLQNSSRSYSRRPRHFQSQQGTYPSRYGKDSRWELVQSLSVCAFVFCLPLFYFTNWNCMKG
jgi:hypothetical protein